MIDKRLYKDISDLLELNVSDDKLVRIMMVRGFTTEQVKRVIRDIRTKSAPINNTEKKTEPVTEMIETAPSKRFSGISALFRKHQNNDEIIAEETQKLANHESALQQEEQKINNQMQELFANNHSHIDSAETSDDATLPNDVIDVLKIMDGLLEKLPADEIKRFAQSPQFKKYKSVVKKYVD